MKLHHHYIIGICTPEGAYCWSQCTGHPCQDVSDRPGWIGESHSDHQ